MDVVVRFARWFGIAAALGIAGCATVPRSDLQTLDIEIVAPSGAAVGAAQCVLNNALGEWSVAAPGKVTLSTDASALQLRCQAAGARGELSVPANVRGGRWGSALVGGGVGLAVGGLIGLADDASNRNSLCCRNLGAMVGAVLGTVAGAGLGAGTADPRYTYPAKLRVVLKPDGLPR